MAFNYEVTMYNHAPDTYSCPFCLLIQGVENEHVYSRQGDIVYQDKVITAFIGSHQWPHNHGNTLIMPNAHFENIYDLPVRYGTEIQRVAHMLALALKRVYDCDGVSTRQHNEPAGNQDVWHYHLHITPCYKGDQFYTTQRKFMPVEQKSQTC